MKTATVLPVQPVTPAKVLRRFRVVFNAVRTHFRQMEKHVGLGGAQVWALSVIQAKPGIGMGEVASSLDIHQSTASNLVKSLLRKELISLDKAPHDRRNVRLTIMPAGVSLLKSVSGPFEGVLPVALASLTGETLQRLDEDLGQLIGLLNADESAGETPLANL
jgi:DNA-binding MarR family transcriptional regulator